MPDELHIENNLLTVSREILRSVEALHLSSIGKAAKLSFALLSHEQFEYLFESRHISELFPSHHSENVFEAQ